MPRTRRTLLLAMLAAFLVAYPVAAGDGDGESDLQGSVEILVRDVSQDGSVQRYEDDFDGLDSGVRLSRLELDWDDLHTGVIDWFRLEAGGFGGDPYEHATFRTGLADVYDLEIRHRKQRNIYDLFGLVDDLDGSTWDSKRSFADVDLTFHLGESSRIFLEYSRVQRDGTSFSLQDVQTELFRLDTPLDQDVERYSLGGKFAVGKADLLIRQTLRRLDYRFNPTTTGDLGLSPSNPASLTRYDWMQDDTGDADLTTVTLSTPLGGRAHLTASAFGTVFGNETLESRVLLDAEGTSSTGTCSITGTACSRSVPCSSVPGDVCIGDPFTVDGGTSRADLEVDYMVIDADVSIRILDGLDFHLQSRSLDREVTGTHLRDLDGNGVPDDTEGTVQDDTPGSETRVDYALDTLTGLFDYAPSSRYRFRLGYRTISRELDRSGFEFGTNENRNADFESDSDDTLILGVLVRPLDWLRLDLDYEEGDVAQAFTATSAAETDRLRLRARIEPRDDMRVDLSLLDYERSNRDADFRQAADCSAIGADLPDGCWFSDAEGSTVSASFWHRPNDNLDYWFRWARQDVKSVTRVRYDTELFFNSTEVGDSVYDNTSTEWATGLNVSWGKPWRAHVRLRINESDGRNDVLGPTFTNRLLLLQDYADLEAGVTYAFENGLYVGGRLRAFDYDDVNDRMDYEGEIVSLLAGMRF